MYNSYVKLTRLFSHWWIVPMLPLLAAVTPACGPSVPDNATPDLRLV